jgi:two-component system CheB/CheR fusion protein
LEEPLRSHLEDLRNSRDYGKSFEFEHTTPGENSKTFNFSGRMLKPDGEMFLLVTIEDITAHKEVQRLLGVEREKLARETATAARELGRTRDDLRALAGSLFTSQEDERRRVARELHDDISQKLAVLEIDTQQIEPQIASNPEEARGELEKVRQSIAALSEDVRRLSHGLHPTAIEDLGIGAAVRSLVEDFREREQMIVTYTSKDVPADLDSNVPTALYRITQEALRNISKHAGKTHVKISLIGGPAGIRLQIVDYGEGFDIQAPRTGLGLISMAERARMVQGTFAIESELGEGTRITVDVPAN